MAGTKHTKIAGLLTGILIACCVVPFPAKADFNQASQSFFQGNYEAALSELRPLAESGNMRAQYLMGRACEYGMGVPTDLSQSLEWYEKSAKQGYTEAQKLTGMMYAEGRGTEKNLKKAVEWYRKAAEANDADAQFLLATMLTTGQGIVQDKRSAIILLRAAAAQGHINARQLLSKLFNYEMPPPRTDINAIQTYQTEAEQNNPEALYAMGYLHENGLMLQLGKKGQKIKLAANLTEALHYYEKAAALNNVGAQLALGRLYSQGTGTVQNISQSLNWYARAASQENVMALIALGDFYERGVGVQRNLMLAHLWYSLALDRSPPGPAYQKLQKQVNDLSDRLSPAELAKSQTLAQSWHPQTATFNPIAARP